MADGFSELAFKLFVPPADGVNDPSQGAGWAENYYTEINSLPKFRIRYEPTELSRYTP